MHHDHVLKKKLNFDLLTTTPGRDVGGSGGWGSEYEIVATMLLHSCAT